MYGHMSADKSFDSIMQLLGVDEFKATVERLRKFQQNKETFAASDVTLPNYLWIAKRGGGVSTCINAFAEYLHAAEIIEFTGIVKYFEFKLAYIVPDAYFSELARLNNTITEIAGHHRYFRGVACINIDEWIQHTNETHFTKFLDYLGSKKDKILAVFYVHTSDKRTVEAIESTLTSYTRLETVNLRFPTTEELLEHYISKYFIKQGFFLTNDAMLLLAESIQEIVTGKHFYGFFTIKQLANDILFSLLTSNLNGHDISADMLSDFRKDSAYIKRIKKFIGSGNVIGFNASMEEY